MCEVMRAPFLAIGSLAICTRISWPSRKRSVIAGCVRSRGAAATAGRSATTIARSYFRDFTRLGRLLGLFDRNLGFFNLKRVVDHLRRLSLERLARRFY